MSAGHKEHGSKRHSMSLEREFKRLLTLDDVRKYLSRDYKVSYDYHIPLTGGSSKDGKTYYIDPDVPPTLRKFVLVHERLEKAFRAVLGESYSRAHTLATIGERIRVERSRTTWEAYKAAIGRIVRKNERLPKGKLPSDFDHGTEED